MNNKVKFIQLLSLICVLGLMTFSIQSCKEDDKPPVVTNDDDNTNPDPLAGKDYFKFEGVRVEFRNPAIGTREMIGSYPSLIWEGNKPTGALGDTTIVIMHPDELVEGTLKVDPLANNDDEVYIQIRWGTVDGMPQVTLTGGSYEMKKVDGKFVSILKNGTGTWTKSNGDKVNYTGIELKATWPN